MSAFTLTSVIDVVALDAYDIVDNILLAHVFGSFLERVAARI